MPLAQTTGPHRDLVGELTSAVRAQGLTMGLYHSMYGHANRCACHMTSGRFEWFNPNWLADQADNFQTNTFVVEKTLPGHLTAVTMYMHVMPRRAVRHRQHLPAR